MAINDTKTFLTRLWHLDNDERPGFIIGNVGGAMIGGTSVRSALFSTEGIDTVRVRLQDPEKYYRAQCEEIDGQAKLRGDYVPALCPSLGVVAIPSAFGCEVKWHERDFPAALEVPGDDPMKVYALPVPAVTGGELHRVMEYTKFFIERSKGSLPIRLTDIQGPLDSAALVMGHNNFLLALRTNPAEAHHVLQLVTRLTIDAAMAQREIVRSRGVEFVPSMFQPWMPDGFGISVSNDECVMMSAEEHDEFSVPYLSQISEAFGGIYIHSCGAWAHQIPSVEKVHHLRGLEFGASEAPYEPVIRHFNGKIMLAARIGLHRDLKFNGMADFVRKIRHTASTNRGLFIHVDITNGIVDDSWPVTDLNEIYKEVGLNE